MLLVVGVLLILGGSMLTGVQPAVAQSGADLAASISGKKTVKLGANITYTLTATNVGDTTATGVHIDGWVPDWFNFVSEDCLTGTSTFSGCDFSDLAPGASAHMTFTVEACCREKRMYEGVLVSATNDTNSGNDTAAIKVVFTGKRR
jgi:large repetitive protein